MTYTIQNLINDNYSKSWQSRQAAKLVALGFDLGVEMTKDLFALIGNILPKIQLKVKKYATELYRRLQSNEVRQVSKIVNNTQPGNNGDKSGGCSGFQHDDASSSLVKAETGGNTVPPKRASEGDNSGREVVDSGITPQELRSSIRERVRHGFDEINRASDDIIGANRELAEIAHTAIAVARVASKFGNRSNSNGRAVPAIEQLTIDVNVVSES